MSSSSISLRPLRSSDARLFHMWWQDPALIRLTSGRSVRFSPERVRRSVDSMIKDTRAIHRMVVVNKKAIGHISLHARPRGWHEIQIVIGEKKYWGKGYGTRTIRAMIRLARRRGIPKIFLEVRPTNLRAIRAYARAGFVEKEICPKRGNPFLREVLRMEYTIEPRS